MAFDWIESHRGLKDHPKTVSLTAVWGDRKPCVLGHLHELWWWTLEYAPDGVIRPGFFAQVVVACEWHARPEKFWSGLVESGFLEAESDGSYAVHDWVEYGARRIRRLQKDRDRKRDVRAQLAGQSGAQPPDNPPKNGVASADISRPQGRAQDEQHNTNKQESLGSEVPRDSVPTNPLPPSDKTADAQAPSGTASAHDLPEQPVPLRDGAGICPLCRQPYLGAYIDHSAAKHKVNSRPANLGRGVEPDAPPPEIAAQFSAMHERLQSLSDNGTA